MDKICPLFLIKFILVSFLEDSIIYGLISATNGLNTPNSSPLYLSIVFTSMSLLTVKKESLVINSFVLFRVYWYIILFLGNSIVLSIIGFGV